jgi:hypothetical protein
VTGSIAGFLTETLGEMAEVLLADFQGNFGDIHFPRVEALTSRLDAQSAVVALEGAAGFCADSV